DPGDRGAYGFAAERRRALPRLPGAPLDRQRLIHAGYRRVARKPLDRAPLAQPPPQRAPAVAELGRPLAQELRPVLRDGEVGGGVRFDLHAPERPRELRPVEGGIAVRQLAEQEEVP